MIKIENFEVMGWEHVIRGMRNPMNSWDRSDSGVCGGGIRTSDVIIVQTEFLVIILSMVLGNSDKQITD